MISFQFSWLLRVTYYPSTILAPSYHFIPVLSADSCYLLSIHNLYVIILSHPSSLGCYLLPIIHPQSLLHHFISSQFSQLIPVTFYPSTISVKSYHFIPVLSVASCYLLSIHNLYVIILSHPSSVGCLCYQVSTHYLYQIISPYSSSVGCFLLQIIYPQPLRHHIILFQFWRLIIQPPSLRHDSISSHFCRLQPFIYNASMLILHNQTDQTPIMIHARPQKCPVDVIVS